MSSPTKKPSKIEELLASLDLGRPRTPDELVAVEAEIRRAFVESQELRKEARPPRGLWKKYLEEVLPLIRLVQQLFPSCKDVICQPNLSDSGNYDATLTLPNGEMTTRLFVEFTYAKDGFEDSLRMEVLNNRGRVNLLGEVTHSGTKNTGHQIEVRDQVVLKSHTLEKHRRLVIDRLKGKANKKYGPDHILVVVFDDFAGFREQDVADLRSCLASEIDLSTLDFRSIYLLGSLGKILSELRIQR
jgi:hypothetical protein